MEENQGVKLLGFWVSPYVLRVKWALKLKGIEYEHIEEDVFNKSPLLLKLNPVKGQVPVLVHDGKPIPESIVILEYIDEVWKHSPLLPRDPYERANSRFWAKFAAEKVINLFACCLDDHYQNNFLCVQLNFLDENHFQTSANSLPI